MPTELPAAPPAAAPGTAAPLFAFVIPVLDEGARLAALLADLGRRFPGADRIVVDGGSADDTRTLAEEGGAVLLHAERGRARQMNLGAAHSRARYLLFLHADSEPLFDARSLRGALCRNPAWGFCRVQLDGPRSLAVVAASMNLRTRLTGIATGDMLIVVRRDVWDACGGYAAIPLMEDVELSTRLRRRCAPTALGLAVRSSGRRWRERGVLPTILHMWWLRLRYWAGADPALLHQSYYGAR